MDIQETSVEKLVTHPLEGVLDIEEHTTTLPAIQRTTSLVPHTSYDDKDKEIEDQLQEVYDAAIISYDTQQDKAEIGDPKYSARTGEVAALFLNTALSAVQQKIALKKHKDDHTVKAAAAKTPKKVSNNLFVGDRNDLLRALMEGGKRDNEL
ncbi:MAG: hypothetical protein ACREAU_07125 [Nitrosopumilaceae archaeon]